MTGSLQDCKEFIRWLCSVTSMPSLVKPPRECNPASSDIPLAPPAGWYEHFAIRLELCVRMNMNRKAPWIFVLMNSWQNRMCSFLFYITNAVENTTCPGEHVQAQYFVVYSLILIWHFLFRVFVFKRVHFILMVSVAWSRTVMLNRKSCFPFTTLQT